MLLTTNMKIKSKNRTKLKILKRLRRGLFQSFIGKLINADVNGAFNILRKGVSCNSLILEITGRGFVFQPLRVYI